MVIFRVKKMGVCEANQGVEQALETGSGSRMHRGKGGPLRCRGG